MRPLVSMATDRVTVGKRRHHVFSNVFDWICFIIIIIIIKTLFKEEAQLDVHPIFPGVILAGNDDIHKRFNEFKIRGDPTMYYGVGCR